MPGTLYDHAVALVVVGALFMFGVVVLPNTSYVNLLHVNEQQLRNRALDSLEAMLLDVGYPENWGTTTNFSQNDVERFGLALSNSSSPYVLDPDKVQRLVENNPVGYIEYNELRELLRLQGYGFEIMVEPAFNVSVEDLAPSQSNNLTYRVRVTYRDTMGPIPDARVKALVLYALKLHGQNYVTCCIEEELRTDELGNCTLKLNLEGEITCAYVVWNVHKSGISVLTATSKGSPPDDVAEINLVGDYIILTKPRSIPNGDVKILDITTVTDDGELVVLYNGTGGSEDQINWGSKDRWLKKINGLKDVNPTLIILDATAPEEGSGRIAKIAVGPFPVDLGSRVLTYGPPGGIPIVGAAVLERSVKIAGLDYVFKLVLWKET